VLHHDEPVRSRKKNKSDILAAQTIGSDSKNQWRVAANSGTLQKWGQACVFVYWSQYYHLKGIGVRKGIGVSALFRNEKGR
jgi:hypothetical protein